MTALAAKLSERVVRADPSSSPTLPLANHIRRHCIVQQYVHVE
jgi:hypothetical protein